MKKAYMSIVLFGVVSFIGRTQVTTGVLDENNCAALVGDIGEFFRDFANSSAGYEVPSGSGKHVIYSAAMWFGGTDINGQLKLAAPRYYPNTQDMWPGALTTDGAATLPVPNPLSQTIWTVTKAEIIYHINNYGSAGYIIPNDILNWPAHGDISVNQSYYLAPFVDTDQNGKYEPQNGDYPCIKGDMALYTIVNDKGGIHGSGGDPIGLEIHYMFYQYSTEPGLADVTFIDARIINRGTQMLNNYISSFWVDADVGQYYDDYIGCDSLRNLIYAYNASSNDDIYDSLPPAVGVVCLNDTITSAVMFSNGAGYPYSDPGNPAQTYNIMNGTWLDGSPFLDDSNQPTSFIYSGDPNNSVEWSEISSGNPPGDRRMVANILKEYPLVAFEEYKLSFAVLFAQDTSNLASVEKLFQLTDEVQYFYDNSMIADCFGSNVGLSESVADQFKLFPNPTRGVITIVLPENMTHACIQIQNVSGELIWKGVGDDLMNEQISLGVSSGVYFVTVQSDRGTHTQKLIVE